MAQNQKKLIQRNEQLSFLRQRSFINDELETAQKTASRSVRHLAYSAAQASDDEVMKNAHGSLALRCPSEVPSKHGRQKG